MEKRGRWAAREDEMRAVLAKWEHSGLPLSQEPEEPGHPRMPTGRIRRYA